MRLDPKTRRSLSLVSGLGFSIALCLGVSILGGVWLDERFQSRPIFVFVGILFGLFGAGSIMYSLARPRSRSKSLPRSENGDQERRV
jgi:putative Ca2+/H+ antiporter (TMEM165/GDT1 family)